MEHQLSHFVHMINIDDHDDSLIVYLLFSIVIIRYKYVKHFHRFQNNINENYPKNGPKQFWLKKMTNKDLDELFLAE